ncbi:PepSY domain-containing protein [Shewanella amazonensis]|uniref:PepSY domain-containing protein n=1 Tax=Shewanella amazonensis (strain ATCC BAA-1098 / SB2B) TaxID=326297 RepID=A1SBH9_SHEAM|nr:hypothetical protein [Shewanella amazonensis]ABM01736.1 conserved hypothetical protein [Shewanella amazonensis SB2B]
MRYWLLGAMMVTAGASANTSLFNLLNTGDRVNPVAMMERVETDHPGYIADFELDVQDGELRYEFDVINADENTLTELTFRAADGTLVLQRNSKLEADDHDELEAVKLLDRKQLRFSELVRMASDQHEGKLMGAQLEHDLGISYLEFKMVDENGKRKHAFDIQKLKPLPMLQWER